MIGIVALSATRSRRHYYGASRCTSDLAKIAKPSVQVGICKPN
jgi:hypothetical protein